MCHVLLLSSSSGTDAQLYEMPGATKAHREKAAVPERNLDTADVPQSQLPK